MNVQDAHKICRGTSFALTIISQRLFHLTFRPSKEWTSLTVHFLVSPLYKFVLCIGFWTLFAYVRKPGCALVCCDGIGAPLLDVVRSPTVVEKVPISVSKRSCKTFLQDIVLAGMVQ